MIKTRSPLDRDTRPACLVAFLVGAVACATGCGAGAPPEDAGNVVDNGDGTWSLRLDSALEVGTTVEKGAITWRYLGQARHAYVAEPVGPQWIEKAPGKRRIDARAQILGARRVDDLGRQWIAVDVDLDELAHIEQKYDERFAGRLPESELAGRGGAADVVEVDQPAEAYEWTPTGWTHPTCSGITYDIFDTDDREQKSSLTDRQKTGVFIQADLGGNLVGNCSGVLLDTRHVLTAAHCVSDLNGNVLATSKLTVCTMGNAYTGADCDSQMASIDVGPWSGGWNPADDYAIIDVGVGLGGVGEDMDMSTASDSFVSSKSMHNTAFPNHAPNPNATCSSTTATAVDTMFITEAHRLVHSEGDITSSAFSTFHYNHDGGPGHSGSPVYYCGDDFCDPGELAFVVSVWSGWNGFWTTHTGPKVREFRSWALGVM